MVFGEEHDYKNFPELTNGQLAENQFTSPHEQILGDFNATVVKVHDGDTVTLSVPFRDFNFPLRFAAIDAPELNTGAPGEESRDWLKEQCEGQDVEVKLDKQRVEKYGRLLGDIHSKGVSMSESMLRLGLALPFEFRRAGELPDMNKELRLDKWF